MKCIAQYNGGTKLLHLYSNLCMCFTFRQALVSIKVLVAPQLAFAVSYYLVVSWWEHPGKLHLEVKDANCYHQATIKLDKRDLCEDKEYKGVYMS